MPIGVRLRLPRENPDRPPVGWKAAFPMLSADGTRVGFRGLTLGSGFVHAPVDDARCAYGRRHRSPARGCGCGFYLLHERAEANALTCATEYREAVVLEVAALGHYVRYQRGMRYQRQRVRRVLTACCACGRPSEAFTDGGTGLPGWRGMIAVCASCAGLRPAVPFPEFARLAGGRLTAACDPALAPPGPVGGTAWTGVGAGATAGLPPGVGVPPLPPLSASGPLQVVPPELLADERAALPQLAAETVLLQARLDRLQEQLARWTDRP